MKKIINVKNKILMAMLASVQVVNAGVFDGVKTKISNGSKILGWGFG